MMQLLANILAAVLLAAALVVFCHMEHPPYQ